VWTWNFALPHGYTVTKTNPREEQRLNQRNCDPKRRVTSPKPNPSTSPAHLNRTPNPSISPSPQRNPRSEPAKPSRSEREIYPYEPPLDESAMRAGAARASDSPGGVELDDHEGVLGDGLVEAVDVEGEHGLGRTLRRRLLRPRGERDGGEREQQRDPAGLGGADRHGGHGRSSAV